MPAPDGLLLLMRHAHAAAEGERDDARPLTPQGRTEARAMGAALASRVPGSLRVWTSPAARCRETAELVASQMAGRATVRTRPELALDAGQEALARAVSEARKPALLVGHAPELGRLATSLLGESAPGLAPATVFGLAEEPGGGFTLAFVLHARDLGPPVTP